MTTIQCSKDCHFQTDGICCCDNILLSVADNSTIYDSECPYRKPKEGAETGIADAVQNNYL